MDDVIHRSLWLKGELANIIYMAEDLSGLERCSSMVVGKGDGMGMGE